MKEPTDGEVGFEVLNELEEFGLGDFSLDDFGLDEFRLDELGLDKFKL